MSKLKRIRNGDIVRFKKDYHDFNGFIPRGTPVRFEGKSLYARFRLLEPLKTWRNGEDTLVLLPYRIVFKILEK